MSEENIRKALKDSAALKLEVATALSHEIAEVAARLASALGAGGKAIFCGNGGSAADSQHLATEIVVRLSGKVDRKALAAISLTTNSSVITACANDYGFDRIFARQLEAIGHREDILFAISTSGNSRNVIEAVVVARRTGMATVGFLGCGGGQLAPMVDYPLVIPSNDVQRIQESHITIGHIIIAELERILGFH